MTDLSQHLFAGINARRIPAASHTLNILQREGDDPDTPPERTVIFVHGNVSSALFWQEIMQMLPEDLRVVALDLRGFGASDPAPVDARRGLRDYSDDLRAALTALEIPSAHLVGWSMGGGVVMQYALDHPALSLTLQAPVAPYGFGGTRRDGSRLTDDDAGCGAGGANPDFVARLRSGDDSDEAPTSPRNVFRSTYVSAGYASDHEDVWVAAMLSTSTEPGNYPGDSLPSPNWPGFGAGAAGVLNAMAPQYFNASTITDLAKKPDVLWIRGTEDAIVSDASLFDLNHLGAIGAIPGWPGPDVAPAQAMVSQTQDVLEAYAAAGGSLTTLVWEGVGHSPHLERPREFCEALLDLIRA